VVEPLPRPARTFFIVLGVGVLALGVWALVRDTPYHPERTPIERFEVRDDATLVLHYTTGGCSGGIDRADVEPSGEELIVSLWDRRQDRNCEDWGAAATHEVGLDAPLDGRTPLDGYCLDPRDDSDAELCPDGQLPAPRPVATR
jgi:hypothetical protein